LVKSSKEDRCKSLLFAQKINKLSLRKEYQEEAGMQLSAWKIVEKQ